MVGRFSEFVMSGDSNSNNIEITCTVKSVVFHNEENGYTIMQVEVKSRAGAITVLGNLPAVVEGEDIRATGKWVDDKRFGSQFRAEQILPVAPTSNSGIERFLASGLIDGIGKTYAKRIVKKFGEDTFRVIEQESQKLQQVEGIGKARRLKIKDSWNRQKAVRDIMIFLHSNGLSTARALRIYKNYGSESVNVLRKDPYRLASDLPGVGFKTADDIARKMGQETDSPQRLSAGLNYVMQLSEKKGHCALPREELLRDAAEILDADAELLTPVLDELIQNKTLLGETRNRVEFLFSPDLMEAEKSVAHRTMALVDLPADYPPIDMDTAIDWFERRNEIKLGPEQADAIAGAMKHRFYIITGGPGVGKTTILNAILKILVAKNVEPVLCAPTGRAAKRLSESTGHEAQTIHRLLAVQYEGGFSRNESNPLDGDAFVVDEASMIDIRLMAGLLEAIPPNGHIILVGDVDQLPSVGPGTVLLDLIESGVVPVIRLQQIYRQAEASQIISVAHDINEGRIPNLENASVDSDFFFIERNDPDAILSTLLQLVRERIPNKFKLDSTDDIQVLTPMHKNSLGTKSLNSALQNSLNPPSDYKYEIERFGVTYRTGDKVIQMRNNYDNEVFNGDIGHIREITTEPARIFVMFEGKHEVKYEPGDLDELQLAYAITIHKSQGSEFPAVVIPLSTQQFVLLQRNLLYTGITRGKRLVILVGDKRALSMAVKNQDSRKRWTGLQGRLVKTQ